MGNKNMNSFLKRSNSFTGKGLVINEENVNCSLPNGGVSAPSKNMSRKNTDRESGCITQGNKKKISRTKRRPPLRQVNSRDKQRHKKTIDMKEEKDEQERLDYIKRKKDDLKRKKKMEEALLRASQGIKLARLHYKLSLLRRFLCRYWLGLMKEIRLKQLKVLSRCIRKSIFLLPLLFGLTKQFFYRHIIIGRII